MIADGSYREDGRDGLVGSASIKTALPLFFWRVFFGRAGLPLARKALSAVAVALLHRMARRGQQGLPKQISITLVIE